MTRKPALVAHNVKKKFARSLSRSMFYGAVDVCRDFFCIQPNAQLRPNEFYALDDVSLCVNQGDSLGLIGRNGSGKSTLLKLLNGLFCPDGGEIQVYGKVGALIEVGAGFHPLLSGRDNIYINGAILGMSRKEIERALDSIIDFAEIGAFIDSPVRNYSSGMFVRLGFSVAVHSNPQILLIDEVLAVGDAGFQAKCFNKIGELRGSGVTTVIVSHNMQVISSFVDSVMVLDKGQGTYYPEVGEGVSAYFQLFESGSGGDYERICSGTERIRFHNVEIPTTEIPLHGDFSATLSYTASCDFDDVEVDLTLYGGTQRLLFHQATNKAYGCRVNLPEGEHSLTIGIHDIPLVNCPGILAIAIWAKDRSELLFWWRIPLKTPEVHFSTGVSFLKASFRLDELSCQ